MKTNFKILQEMALPLPSCLLGLLGGWACVRTSPAPNLTLLSISGIKLTQVEGLKCTEHFPPLPLYSLAAFEPSYSSEGCSITTDLHPKCCEWSGNSDPFDAKHPVTSGNLLSSLSIGETCLHFCVLHTCPLIILNESLLWFLTEPIFFHRQGHLWVDCNLLDKFLLIIVLQFDTTELGV